LRHADAPDDVSPDARGQAPGGPGLVRLTTQERKSKYYTPAQSFFHSGKWEVVCGPAFQVINAAPPA